MHTNGMNPCLVQQSSLVTSEPETATVMGIGGMSTIPTRLDRSPVRQMFAPPSIRSLRTRTEELLSEWMPKTRGCAAILMIVLNAWGRGEAAVKLC